MVGEFAFYFITVLERANRDPRAGLAMAHFGAVSAAV
jgi:hypothetical protein